MNHTVITGGPSTGKTSLTQELKSRGHSILEESAKDLITRALKGELIPLPWEDLIGFETETHLLQRAREDTAHSSAFLDRSLVDIVAYCKAYGIPTPPGLMDDILSKNYGPVFLLARLPVFTSENYRSELDTEGYRLGTMLGATYTQLGFTVIEVPAFDGVGDSLDARIQDSIAKRADFVLKARTPEQGNELEVKARTNDINRVRLTLGSYPGSFARMVETDRYVPVMEGAHRVRRRIYDNGTVKYIETRKGVREDSAMNVRPETNKEVDQERFLTVPYDLEVVKRREIFSPRFSPGVEVSIDSVEGLGAFVEVEGETRHAVNQWAGQLLLPPNNWEKRSYEQMAREAQRK